MADWLVPLSSFAGANDDDRLDAFAAWSKAQTYHGAICQLDEMRTYTFNRQHPLFNGFAIQGAGRPQDQGRSSKPIGQLVKMRQTGDLFPLAQAQTFGTSISHLSLDGNAGNRLIDGHPTNVLWTSVLRDISCQNAGGVLGSSAQKLLVTATSVDGWWNVNNVRDRAFSLGGSDFYFQPSMFLLDSGPALMPASGYLGSFDNLSNAWFSNIYCTADGHSAFRIAGGSNDNSLFIERCVMEGRNSADDCPGALVRMSGGQASIASSRFAFAMQNPAATGNGDLGVIHQTGGSLTIEGCTYQRDDGTPESTPFLYVTGTGRARVRNIIRAGSWAGKPQVRQSVPGLIDADSSVTVVTG